MHGEPWTQEQSTILIKLYLQGASNAELCAATGRSPRSVYSRLAWLRVKGQIPSDSTNDSPRIVEDGLLTRLKQNQR